jgi:protoporphyrinogen oxidase
MTSETGDSRKGSTHKTAVIIGAGPAGLTAAYELLKQTDIRPIVLEKTDTLGGISRTVQYKGNRIDIGGHRFFSKSDRVMRWWQEILPLQAVNGTATLGYQGMRRAASGSPDGPNPDAQDLVMLLRSRKSRIYFLRQFFDYPITLSASTVRKLGPLRTARIGVSYLRSVLMPIKDERNLEDFFINRFGRALYETFFKSYTEKVWGVSCTEISAEWGAQRIKGLSIVSSITHAVKKLWRRPDDINQKGVETSLIEQFLYPKYGPGQMWEEVARRICERGGQILMNVDVDRLETRGQQLVAVQGSRRDTGERLRIAGDYVFSTMPVKDLVQSLDVQAPAAVKEVSDGLMYRDFITVGLLLKEMKVRDDSEQGQRLIHDNWVYIQEPDVLVGRMQVFNNWSPYMVADPSTVWLGLEYFCYEGDGLWTKSDGQLIELAGEELAKIGIIDKSAILDATVIRMPKTYPAYFGTYNRFSEVQRYLDAYENLFLIGRNGMHRYNNQDHSMLTAMVAVENIIAGSHDKASIWDVNTEQEYHESK